MTTLPPPGTNEFPDSSIEKKLYGIVESFADYIPVTNENLKYWKRDYRGMCVIEPWQAPAGEMSAVELTKRGMNQRSIRRRFWANLQ